MASSLVAALRRPRVTDYVDLCGEPALDAGTDDRRFYAATAERAARVSLFSCGLRLLSPSDLGVYFLQRKPRKQLAGHCAYQMGGSARWKVPSLRQLLPASKATMIAAKQTPRSSSYGQSFCLDARLQLARRNRQRASPNTTRATGYLGRTLSSWLRIKHTYVHAPNALLGHALRRKTSSMNEML